MPVPVYGFNQTDARGILNEYRQGKSLKGADSELVNRNNPRTYFERLSLVALQETLPPGTTGTEGVVVARRLLWDATANEGTGTYSVSDEDIDLSIPISCAFWGIKGEIVLARENGNLTERFWEMIGNGAPYYRGTVTDVSISIGAVGHIQITNGGEEAVEIEATNVSMCQLLEDDIVLVFPNPNNITFDAFIVKSTRLGVVTGVSLGANAILIDYTQIDVLWKSEETQESLAGTTCPE